MKLRIIFIFLWTINAFASGMPVFDIANWLENGKILLNQVAQYKTQIEQYRNQLLQYQNMVNNTQSLSSFQWDNANNVINNLLDATNTIDYYKQEAGSLENYLDRYQSQEHYQNTSCFNNDNGCTKEKLEHINHNRMAASVAQKRANDAMFKGIDNQQQNLKTDSEKLRILQSQAQGAQGQKQALQAATQLASNQSHQLLQIRGLLIAQQNAQITKDAGQANKEALQNAGDERFRAGNYHKSSGKKW